MRIGFIGTGAIARRHLLALRECPVATEITCHLATSGEKAMAAAREWGGTGFVDIGAFLREGQPDAVFVTVPPHRHGAIERALIDAGVPFLVEKPLSADRQAAEDIAAALRARDLVTAVGYQWRALDALPRVRALLRERGASLVSARYLAGTPDKAWWRRQADSGGQIVEQACHLIDLARHLTGAAEVLAAMPARRVRPAWPDADIAVATAALLRFGEDIPGVVEATCLAPQLQDASLLLVGEGWSATIAMTRTVIDVDGQRTDLPQAGNAYARQAEAFLDAVTRRRPADVLCTYEDALATHRVCHDINDWPSRGKA